jgi:hypothetical protein
MNYLEDEFDQDYVLQLFSLLINSLQVRQININNVIIPLPDEKISKL